jgi:Alr-MurF fusion protein
MTYSFFPSQFNFLCLMLLTLENTYQQIIDKQLVTDSRQLIKPDQAVFFAIKGRHHNGHDYIQALHKQGVRHFVVEQDFLHTPLFALLNDEETYFIAVHQVLSALQLLAAWHRQQFTLPVIGITGSNGKTIIKEWLGQLLSTTYQVVKSPKSYNSQLGVPLSVWQLNVKHEIAVFEAGISKPNEMHKLQAMIKPQVGILTNIGTAHDEGFATREQKILEKLKLFVESSLLIYCTDHQAISPVLQTWQAQHPTVTLFAWGASPSADLQIMGKQQTAGGVLLQFLFKQQVYKLQLPFADTIFIENALHCLAILLCLGFEVAKAENLLQSLKPVAMRLELKGGINDCLLIDDTYNNDLAGLQVALNFLQQHSQKPKSTIILSDMLESGTSPNELYPKIAQLLANYAIDKVVGIGREISSYAALFEQKESYFFEQTADFLTAIKPEQPQQLHTITATKGNKLHFSTENILVKGARSFEFEQIIGQLQAKIHGTVLELNLEALTHNLNFYRSLLTPETKIMVMVKAFAYGSGSFEVAKLLAYQKVDYLAVAYTDEGVALRQQAIHLPIMVMNPSPESFDKLLQYDLEPEIYSFRLLTSFLAYLQQQYANKTMPQATKIHLKIDTGMHRLGFEPSETKQLIAVLQATNLVTVASVFTHLSGADSQDFDDFSLHQLRTFCAVANELDKATGKKILRHACNSAGIVRFAALLTGAGHVLGIDQSVGNMVRLGIGLYGIEANGLLQEKLRPIGTLKTVISQIKLVKQGETIGYSRKGKAEKTLKIATLAIGYADGFSRKFSNGQGKVLVNKQLAPIIGNVCMDMCMADITGIDAQEGDEVIVFGKDLPVSSLAATLATIPYEILTSISERVKRVFVSE